MIYCFGIIFRNEFLDYYYKYKYNYNMYNMNISIIKYMFLERFEIIVDRGNERKKKKTNDLIFYFLCGLNMFYGDYVVVMIFMFMSSSFSFLYFK